MDFGITCDVNASSVIGCAIEGNTFLTINFTALSRAIWLDGTDSTNRYIVDVSISNNSIREVGYHGLSIDYCRNVTLNNNSVTDCQRAGLWIFGSSDFSVIGNTASNNDLAAFGNTDFTIGFSGSNDTVNGAVTGNAFSKGRVNEIDYVIMRQNAARTSLSIGGTVTNSSTNENLVAGVLS